MEDFNPDAFLAEAPAAAPSLAAGQFNPDAFLNEAAIESYDANQAQYGSLPQQLLTGVEAAAHSLAPGLAVKAELATGLTTPQDIRGRQEANPGSKFIGDLAGTGALIAGTGGAGALARGAGLAAKTAAYAAEGAALAAAQLTNEAALGDADLNAQKVLTHLGLGAVLGGALGAGSRAIEVGAPVVSSKLTGLLNKVSKGEGSFAAGLAGKDVQTSTRELVQNVSALRTARKEAVKEMYDTVLPAQMKVALEDMNPALAKQAYTNLAKEIVPTMKTVGAEGAESALSRNNAKIVETALKDMSKAVEGAKSSYEVQKAIHDFATNFDKTIKFGKIPSATEMAEQQILSNVRNTVRGFLKNEGVWGQGAKIYGEVSDLYNAVRLSDKNIAKSFMAKTGDGKLLESPSKLKSFFNNMDDVSNDLRRQHLDEFMNVTKQVAAKADEIKGLNDGVKAITEHVEKLGKKQLELAELSRVINSSKEKGMLEHLPLGVGKVLHELKPYNLGKHLGKAFSHVQGLADIIKKADAVIGKEARAVFSAGTRASTYQINSAADFDKKAKQIREFAHNPEKAFTAMADRTVGLHDSAPNIVTALHTTTGNAMGFLASKLPRPASELPMAGNWEPSKSQKAQFMTYYNAVENPLSVLKQIKNGSLSNEAMEALQVVHPKLLQEMRLQVMASIKPNTQMPYATRLSVAKFLGVPMDQQMLPGILATNQASLAQPVMPSGNDLKPTQGGLKELDIAGRSETELQAVERRRDD
jgi:hypothetical protein